MTFITNVTTVLVLLFAGAYLYVAYKYFLAFMSETHNKGVLKSIRERDYLREELLATTDSERIAFFKTHNGHGEPSHTKVYKTSCVRGARYQEKMYKDVLVDTLYTEMLLYIIENPDHYYDFITSEEPISMLKEYYEAEGIARSLIFYIKSTKSGIYYASFSKSDPAPFNPEDIIKIKNAISVIRKLKDNY